MVAQTISRLLILAFLSFFALIWGPLAFASVTLTDQAGKLSITGELISYESGVYTIDSTIGVLEIDSDQIKCEGDDCPDINQLVRVAGSDRFVVTLVPELFKALADNTDARHVIGSGSETGSDNVLVSNTEEVLATLQTLALADTTASFDSLLAGDVDIVFTDRRATESEVERFLDAGLGNLRSKEQELVFGIDAVSILVAQDNPLTSISQTDLDGIYSGQITNWSQLGGPDQPIKAYAPGAESSLSQYFQSVILEENFSDYSDDIVRVDTNEDVVGIVASEPAAIGFASSIDTSGTRKLSIRSNCGLINPPNEFSFRSEDYPLTRRLYAYIADQNIRGYSRKLYELLANQQGQQIVENSGFLSQKSNSANLENFGHLLAYSLANSNQEAEDFKLREFAEEVVGANRLSTTFRFASGSSNLDNKSLSDLSRLADQIKNSNSEVLLIGFTDSIGRGSLNEVLSVRRAEQVIEQLNQVSGGTLEQEANITPMGFGAAYPVACNENNRGRELNRRVEVWLR